jgi:uncharacterized membrane protein
MPAPRAPRLALVDALRGFAVAQMIVYHFIYDLDYFGWVDLAMNRDHPWVGWRTAIVSQFLLLVGVSLVLRTSFRPSAADFWKRWSQVAGAALLVSAGSWMVFGPRFIYFGILHFIAAALLIARPAVGLGAWNLALGAAVIVAGLAFAHPSFDTPPATIIGFMTHKPPTEDYVPLFPWLGVVFVGIGLGTLWQRAGWSMPAWLQRWNAKPPRVLVLLGTWALTVYLLHQPLMLGALALFRRFAA